MTTSTATFRTNPILENVIHAQRRLRRWAARLGSRRLGEAQFLHLLKQLGIAQGSTIMVHSSWAAIARVCDFAPTRLIELLEEHIGQDGTLAMPVFPFQGAMADYVASLRGQVDVRRLPAKTSLLCELFRRGDRVHHSLHPTHPVCAKGPLADWLTAGHLIDDTPFGRRSPFHRLAEVRGLLVGLGVDYRHFANFHLSESLFSSPDEFAHCTERPVQIACTDRQRGQWSQTVRPMRAGLRRCGLEQFWLAKKHGGVHQLSVAGVPFIAIQSDTLLQAGQSLARKGHTLTNCSPSWRFLERLYLLDY